MLTIENVGVVVVAAAAILSSCGRIVLIAGSVGCIINRKLLDVKESFMTICVLE